MAGSKVQERAKVETRLIMKFATEAEESEDHDDGEEEDRGRPRKTKMLD